jgi:hypothetical protein
LLASKQREQHARELLQAENDEELSEEEIQKQLEKQELFRMRKAVQAMRQAGDIERYNSLRLKEKHEDERIEQQLIDLNTKNNNAAAS